MSRFAISRVEEMEHPCRPGKMIKAPVIVRHMVVPNPQPDNPGATRLTSAEFHIFDERGWALCRLDEEGYDITAIDNNQGIFLLPDLTMEQEIGSRVLLRQIKNRLGILADIDSPSNWRELLNALGKELGSGFDVDRWGAAR